jgi:hypothetical protein
MSPETNQHAADCLRLYIIDRLGSSILHDLRNGLQGILGHTALIRSQTAGHFAASDLPQKLQAAADRCRRGTVDLNTILSLPSQQHSSVRLHGMLREQRPFLQSILRDEKTLNLSIDPTIESARVSQQPLLQLILLWLLRARDLHPVSRVLELRTSRISDNNGHSAGVLPSSPLESMSCSPWKTMRRPQVCPQGSSYTRPPAPLQRNRSPISSGWLGCSSNELVQRSSLRSAHREPSLPFNGPVCGHQGHPVRIGR